MILADTMNHAPKPAPRYVLGDSEDERQRLRLQAELVEPFTERLFQAAGIGRGMRVLDLGCGMGDVSFLLARMVGPGGEVTGVDRNAAILEAAGARNRYANVTFVHSELNEYAPHAPFDAVVGRYILVYQTDPVATLRHAASLLKSGGVLAFHEADQSGEARSYPESRLWNMCMHWIVETFKRSGGHPDLGIKLPVCFRDAGLPVPHMMVDVMMGGGPDTLIYAWAVTIVRSLAPRIVEYALATEEEIGVATLEDRLRAEVCALGGSVMSYPSMGAWVKC